MTELTPAQIREQIKQIKENIDTLQFAISNNYLSNHEIWIDNVCIIQKNIPFNLYNEVELLLNDSIDEWQRQIACLQFLINQK